MNMLTRWVPGDILVAVGDGGVLALDGSAQAMEAMWTELGEHRCLGDLLKSLSRLHDNEVFTLPDFLMMAIDGQELRVAARGRFCLHLDTADGERSFSASEVVVWEESRYERVNQCILELTPATRHPAGPEGLDEFLPLRSGIVRASQLHIGFGDHQLPLSSPAQTGAHGGQGAPQPSAAQEILQQAQADGAPERTVFHCFSGGSALAAACAEHGWYASVAGPLTYPANDSLREAVAALPDELLLVETDAPYLPPRRWRGRPNASYLLGDTVRFLAEQRGLSEEDLCRRLQATTEAVYGSW